MDPAEPQQSPEPPPRRYFGGLAGDRNVVLLIGLLALVTVLGLTGTPPRNALLLAVLLLLAEAALLATRALRRSRRGKPEE